MKEWKLILLCTTIFLSGFVLGQIVSYKNTHDDDGWFPASCLEKITPTFGSQHPTHTIVGIAFLVLACGLERNQTYTIQTNEQNITFTTQIPAHYQFLSFVSEPADQIGIIRLRQDTTIYDTLYITITTPKAFD